MKIRIVDIKIPEWYYRRRIRSFNRLVKSLKELGQMRPILVTKEMRLVDGYNRIEALKELKKEYVYCNFMEDTEAYSYYKLKSNDNK